MNTVIARLPSLIQILFFVYLAQLIAWVWYLAHTQGFSPWPVMAVQVAPLSLLIYSVIKAQVRGLVYLNLMLTLYFCANVLGLFQEGAKFFVSVAQTVTLVLLFTCVYLYLRDLKQKAKQIA